MGKVAVCGLVWLSGLILFLIATCLLPVEEVEVLEGLLRTETVVDIKKTNPKNDLYQTVQAYDHRQKQREVLPAMDTIMVMGMVQ